MKTAAESSAPSAEWEGPGCGRRRRFRWSELLWSIIFPARSHRIKPTLTGMVLISMALGIGSAAYNTASNILFITLSLLLACLILSGVMSWQNLRGVCWRLLLQPPLRAGQEAPVTLELWNRKALLPTHGLWFELSARPVPRGPQRPESTVTATSADIRAAFARREAEAMSGRLRLRERLDPDQQARLDWLFVPARRGVVRVELASVGSLFPFGFLSKNHGTRLRREAVVWPAPVAYRVLRPAAALRQSEGERVARPGSSDDLLALRRYQPGDSHRLIHWKASARLRQLLVRQFAAESAEGFSLWLQTPAAVWLRPEQFELLCGLACTLAEDLFTAGQLVLTAVNAEEPLPIRRVRDLESFLDRVAVLEPEDGDQRAEVSGQPAAPKPLGEGGRTEVRGQQVGDEASTAASASRPPFVMQRRNVITFAPEGVRGVAAFVDGNKTATA